MTTQCWAVGPANDCRGKRGQCGKCRRNFCAIHSAAGVGRHKKLCLKCHAPLAAMLAISETIVPGPYWIRWPYRRTDTGEIVMPPPRIVQIATSTYMPGRYKPIEERLIVMENHRYSCEFVDIPPGSLIVPIAVPPDSDFKPIITAAEEGPWKPPQTS